MSKEKPSSKGSEKQPEKAKKPAVKAAAKSPAKSAAKPAAKSAQKKPEKQAVKTAEKPVETEAAKAETGRSEKPRAAAARPPKHTTGYRANVPFLRVSPTKIRRIADHLRRKPYVEAIALLDVLPHKGARLLRKVIQSAAANALAQNKGLDEQMLYVKELLIDGGPTMKRMWARGRGRADRLLKRSSHIFVVVDEIGRKEVDNGSEG